MVSRKSALNSWSATQQVWVFRIATRLRNVTSQGNVRYSQQNLTCFSNCSCFDKLCLSVESKCCGYQVARAQWYTRWTRINFETLMPVIDAMAQWLALGLVEEVEEHLEWKVLQYPERREVLALSLLCREGTRINVHLTPLSFSHCSNEECWHSPEPHILCGLSGDIRADSATTLDLLDSFTKHLPCPHTWPQHQAATATATQILASHWSARRTRASHWSRQTTLEAL